MMESQKERSRRGFDQQAGRYDHTSLGAHARQLHPLLLRQLGQIPHQRVLDVGCGTGALLDQLSRRWPEGQYTGVDLSCLLYTSIGASGAVMDLSVDITSAIYEVVEKRPDLNWKEAARSGVNVGRAAMGTMTTTLLFAYSGGYIALLMVFMAQGTPVDHILNYKYVAAELIHTVIGSFGLVTVAPFTALCGGLFLAGGREGQVRSLSAPAIRKERASI